MADRIVVLHDGIVEQIGSPLELYDRPANQFVAGFIGSPAMNFIKGHVDASGQTFVAETGAEIALKDTPREVHGRTVTLGIRPEHFVLDAQNGLASQVIVVEPTGAEMQIICQFAGQPVTAVFHERLNVRPDDVIKLAPKPEAIHLFDAATGVALR